MPIPNIDEMAEALRAEVRENFRPVEDRAALDQLVGALACFVLADCMHQLEDHCGHHYANCETIEKVSEFTTQTLQLCMMAFPGHPAWSQYAEQFAELGVEHARRLSKPGAEA